MYISPILEIKRRVALKIYKRNAHSLDGMGRYIHGDPGSQKLGNCDSYCLYMGKKNSKS